MPNPGRARARVERELYANPRRSDALIAAAAHCTPQAAGRWRHILERSGVIDTIEPSQRASITRTWPARPPRQAIEQGATTPAEVMAIANVSYGTAWRALSRAQRAPRKSPGLQDLAAATDQLSVIRTPPKRIGKAHVVGDKPGTGYYIPHDPASEWWCCVEEWTATGWQHERSCPARLAASR